MISAIFYKIVALELNIFKMIGTIQIIPLCRRKRMNLQAFLPSVLGSAAITLVICGQEAYGHRLTHDSSVT